jgi:hypothetical protein
MSPTSNARVRFQTHHRQSWAGTVAVLMLCLAWCAPSAPAFAQGTGATLNGTITDPTGAMVPNADILISQKATGQTRTTVTNQRGFFSVPNLPSGAYDITVIAPGFTQAVQENVQLDVGQVVVSNIKLQVADVKESITVVAAPSSVALASSTLSNVVDGKTVREMPINGRDWTLLAALEPGVHTIEAQTALSAGGNARANRGWGTQMSFGGNRPQQNNYRLDGISINDYSGGGPGGVLGSVLGVDAVQEFSVVTGNASADYGKTSGGVLNAVTRGGQNALHGSVYEFHRDSAWDAKNFFDTGDPLPFKRNQFGGSVGGPIRRDHTFFFFDYEGLRQNLTSTSIITVPSRAARTGQLTAGKVTVDPAVVPFLNIYPLPNGAETGDLGAYSFTAAQVASENLFTGRLDHSFSAKDLLHGTVYSDRSRTEGPDTFNFVQIAQISNRRMATLEETHVFSPSLVNILRLGYSNSESFAPVTLGTIDSRAADTSLAFVPGQPVGTMEISGVTTFNGGLQGIGESDHKYNSFQLYEDIIHTRGAHAIKAGFSFERIYYDTTSQNAPNGRFVFGSLANFLTNKATSFNASIPGATPTIQLRQSVFGAFVQDDFRVRPNLTLNLGLRYEPVTVPIEAQNLLSNMPTLTSTGPRLGSPYFTNPTKLNFSPRLGFAWDPFKSGKTSIRGGVGIYDTLPTTYQFALLVVNTGPYFKTGTITSVPVGSFPTKAFTLLSSNDTRYSYVDSNPKRSYITQWNLNVERQLPGDLVAHVGYVGAHGVHQPFRTNDANIVVPTVGSDGSLLWPLPKGSGTRVNTGVGVINALAWIGRNTYNSLNVSVSRRQKSVRVGVSYTLSKSMDLSSSSTAGSNFNNSIVGPLLQFPNAMWGLSDFDIRHNVVVNATWEVPHPAAAKGALRVLAEGWQLSGIFRAASGLPFTPVIGGDSLGMLNGNPFNFPDRVTGSGCDTVVNPGNPLQYIKTQCFVAPALGRLGNSGRNSAIGPGLMNLDFSLVKTSKISKDANIQLRFEVFNALNRANFSVPDRTVSQVFNASFVANARAGVLTGTATPSRQLQAALKVTW